MKQALQRIHATLDQLETLKQSTTEPSPVTDRPLSFQILPVAPKVDLPPPSAESERPHSPQSPQLPQFSTSSVEPSPTTTIQVERSPSAPIVDLERIAQRIQALYYEGPIVDAWIDSYPTAPESDDEIEEIVFERPDLLTTDSSGSLDRSLSPTSYRVCGFDASGEQWSYPCPLDQLLELSVAIARYHKIQELLAQKRQLESQIESNAIGENINNS
ncbi:hypothetical protein [Scytonema millei]|uniref:Uncharacterized protein n=1 Tax=Scytonema millei VB511283 TaxID=1245923 RepID=A0A9X5E5W7_9CYAN|nr:hypothetical protein [Scytonema millei]NHC35890.1 hypothetical protein [Scytonema millei VB511283]